MIDPPRTPTSTVSSATTSPNILPLHPTNISSSMSRIPASAPSSVTHDRQIIQRRMSEKPDSKFASPTDDLLSPCSQRLKEYKARKATRLAQTLFKNTKAGVPTATNLFPKRSSENPFRGSSSDHIGTKNETCTTTDDQKGMENGKDSGYDL